MKSSYTVIFLVKNYFYFVALGVTPHMLRHRGELFNVFAISISSFVLDMEITYTL